MTKLLRKKLAWITILIYWPALFILVHIPLPRVIQEAHLSDKSIHFMAYFILVVLLWSVVKPYDKVKWYKATVWIILAVIIGYGAVDEWLQSLVETRTPDIRDFLFDLTGACAGLLLLSIVSFRPAMLLTAGLTIFLTTGCSRTELIENWPAVRIAFYFLSYAAFTSLWLFCLHRTGGEPDSVTSPQVRWNGLKWLIIGSALPILLLVCVKIGTFILGRRFVGQDILTSALGIVCTMGAFLLVRQMKIVKTSA